MLDWKKHYEELKALIAKNPDLELTPSVICIPPEIRGEFYRLFDAIRISIIKDNFPGMLEAGAAVSRAWIEAVQKAIADYKLKNIEMDIETTRFLDNPEDGLARILFDPLFDVLRGKKDLASFERDIPGVILTGYKRYIRDGYHAWTTLSLLGLMGADELLTVKPSELDEDPSLHVEMTVQGLTEELPNAVEATKLTFKQILKFSFLFPNVIAHSVKIGSYISFVPDFEYSEAKWLAKNLPQDRTWFEMSALRNTIGQTDLWPDIAIYQGKEWKDVVIAADTVYVGRPDIILELRTEKDWFEREGIESIKRHYDALSPTIGSFVICLNEVPLAAFEALAPKPPEKLDAAAEVEDNNAKVAVGEEIAPPVNAETAAKEALEEALPPPPKIHLLSVGLDVAKLQPVIDAMISPKTGEEPAATPAG